MNGFSISDLHKSAQVRDGCRRFIVRAGRVQNASSTSDLDASVHLHDGFRLIDMKYRGYGEIRHSGDNGGIDQMMIARTVGPGLLSTQDTVIKLRR